MSDDATSAFNFNQPTHLERIVDFSLRGLLAVLLVLLIVVIFWRIFDMPGEGAITREGNYRSPSGDFQLVVMVSENGIVDYKITDAHTGETLAGDGGFSTHHRWMFYWEGDALWTHNSDMGPLGYWSHDDSGVWAIHRYAEREQLPQPFYNYLPNTMKKRLKPRDELGQ
jgi:hypothetical protein